MVDGELRNMQKGSICAKDCNTNRKRNMWGSDMKNSRKFVAFVCLILLSVLAVRAADVPDELDQDPVSIGDIIENPAQFQDSRVVVDGKITTQCSVGCWFTLDDETGTIYVDIAPNNFTIPKRAGSDARVYGQVSIKDGDPYIIGEIVKIGSEIFR